MVKIKTFYTIIILASIALASHSINQTLLRAFTPRLYSVRIVTHYHFLREAPGAGIEPAMGLIKPLG